MTGTPTLSETVTDLQRRVAVLEEKLDIALRAISLTTVGVKPGIEWMDSMLSCIEDPRQMGVKRS